MSVTVQETPEKVIITVLENLSLNVGAKGDKGDKGDTGAPGPPGPAVSISIEVVPTYASIDIISNVTARLIVVNADETNNNGNRSIYLFDGNVLNQLLTFS